MQIYDQQAPSAGRRGQTRRPDTASVHFGPMHPLAGLVAERCKTAGHHPRSWHKGCGPCWEWAIRADERFVVEFDLDDGLTPIPSPTAIDEIAVDRACAGQRVRLTATELAVAVAWLNARGLTCEQIARRLQRSHSLVRGLLTRLDEEAAT